MARKKEFSGRDFYWLLAIALAVNLVLWLDSFDRYVSSYYHVYLAQYLPDYAYAPSRELEALLKLNGQDDETDVAATGTAPLIKNAPAQTVLLASAPARIAQTASAPAAATAMPGKLALAASAGKKAETVAAAGPPRILFAGDSMMQGVAPFVIARMHRRYPHGLFVDASKESTGLTVRRYFDWPAKIREDCLSQALTTLVVFLGPNDPWNIYDRKKRKLYVFPSSDWQQEYRRRVDQVLDFATARGLRVIWIGMPAMRDDHIEQGARVEDAIFEQETKKYNFEYMPTGDIIGPVDQPYQKYVDEPGQGRLVVRAKDGVHFTSAGLRMISSRVVAMLTEKD